MIDVPAPGRAGCGEFVLTDDYSVFHFSKMPDQIPDKGEVIARMAASTLLQVARAGVPTHLLAFEPPRTLRVRLLNILDPAHGELHEGDCACLVPLQVIYRNMLPAGASVYRRLAAGKATLQDLGLDVLPEPDSWLTQPIIEFTTKLEEIDRFVSADEARAIACLSEQDFATMYDLTCRTNAVVCDIARQRGLVCADGKIEFGIDDNGRIILVDVAGTPDENRFLFNGRHASKQSLRDYYLAYGLELRVQRLASTGRPRATWTRPDPLPGDLLESVAEMYRSLCERWTDETIWGACPLGDAVALVDRTLARYIAT